MSIITHPFEPVYDSQSRILILGSFPSVVSREKNFYYANKNNRFCKVMEIIFDEKIEDRKLFCLSHHIALWDVIASCSITGSSDASIKDVCVNDIASLIENTEIHTVFTTGRKAYSLYEKYVDCPLEAISLPSTSGANAAMHLEDLVDAYRIIVEETCY